MSSLVESITVNVPAQEAFGQWSRLHTLPRSLDDDDGDETVRGGRTHWTIDIGGITRRFDADLATVNADRRLAWESVTGPKHSGSVEFEPIDPQTTRVTAQLHIDPAGYAETAAERLGLLDVRLRRDLEQFKDYMELSGVAEEPD